MTTTLGLRRLVVGMFTIALALSVAPSTADARSKRSKHSKKKKRLKKLKPIKAPYLTDDERALWHQVRLLRRSPAHYASTAMVAFRGLYEGVNVKVGDQMLETNEGIRAVDDAIKQLAGLRKLKRIKLSKGLSRAAKEHAVYLGKTGKTDHLDSSGNGPGARMDRYGEWSARNVQMLSFFFKRPQDVLPWLVTNDGIRSRGYRRALINPRFRVGGVGCAPHKAYQFNCVLLFTEKFKPHRGGPKPLETNRTQLKVYVPE